MAETYKEAGCGELTVVSANLWHDWPRFRRLKERLEVFVRLIEEQQADLILLQEVARALNARRGAGPRLAEAG